MLPPGTENVTNYLQILPRELRELNTQNLVSILISKDSVYKDSINIHVDILSPEEIFFEFSQEKYPTLLASPEAPYGITKGYRLEFFLNKVDNFDRIVLLNPQNLFLTYQDERFIIMGLKHGPATTATHPLTTFSINSDFYFPLIKIDRTISKILAGKLALIAKDLRNGKFNEV